MEAERVGGAMWALRTFRRDALTQFLKDLEALAEQGLGDKEGKQVADTLEQIVKVAERFPEGSVLRAVLWPELENLRAIYLRWLAIKGTGPQVAALRNRTRREMSLSCQKFSRLIRKHRSQLLNEVQREPIDEIYQRLKSLVEAFPNKFPHLNLAVNRYQERLASVQQAMAA